LIEKPSSKLSEWQKPADLSQKKPKTAVSVHLFDPQTLTQASKAST
jgi:hypothetical protein